jgi:hypothetical protein
MISRITEDVTKEEFVDGASFSPIHQVDPRLVLMHAKVTVQHHKFTLLVNNHITSIEVIGVGKPN